MIGSQESSVLEGSFLEGSILEGSIVPTARLLYQDEWLFQHDNDPKHTAALTKQWFGDDSVVMLVLPGFSPDLNSSENI